MASPAVSVIVPTLNAEGEVGPLLDVLLSQSLAPSEVLVVDSSSDDGTRGVVRSYEGKGVRLEVIARADFDHGATRDMALRMTSGEYACFLTQDALPASGEYLERLVAPLEADPSVALASGRQLPRPGARRYTQLVQAFNYPAEPSVRSAADVSRLGVKAFFASDVCSCYRRSAYLACGGFPATETNEDMLMAARLLAAGHKVAYEPSAAVVHSHDLALSRQFSRNRAVGRFLAESQAELMGASEVGEGARLARAVASRLLREGRPLELAAFCLDCAARLLGNRVGRAEGRKGNQERGKMKHGGAQS